jgi:penicillin-insensitive murein endopeptidase
VVAIAFPALVAAAWLRVALDSSEPSRSRGTVNNGSLEHGRAMPPWGSGFLTYSFLGSALGRQYVHAKVRDTLVAAFAAHTMLEHGRRFVMGETGWPGGGRIRPHRTHENGMSVDVFMPVDASDGTPRRMPTWPWNKFGYALEFDATGRFGDLHIDFEALAGFLREVDAEARARGLRVERIIVAPEYVPLLLETESGKRLGNLAACLTRRPVWIRHDEHFHIDFAAASEGR